MLDLTRQSSIIRLRLWLRSQPSTQQLHHVFDHLTRDLPRPFSNWGQLIMDLIFEFDLDLPEIVFFKLHYIWGVNIQPVGLDLKSEYDLLVGNQYHELYQDMLREKYLSVISGPDQVCLKTPHYTADVLQIHPGKFNRWLAVRLDDLSIEKLIFEGPSDYRGWFSGHLKSLQLKDSKNFPFHNFPFLTEVWVDHIVRTRRSGLLVTRLTVGHLCHKTIPDICHTFPNLKCIYLTAPGQTCQFLPWEVYAFNQFQELNHVPSSKHHVTFRDEIEVNTI